MIAGWEAAGSPAPLSFAARFVRHSAEALRRAGQSDEWIRREILAIYADNIGAHRGPARAKFLETVEQRLAEALPPMPEPETPSAPPPIDPDQEGFDSWVEAGDSSDTAPLLLMAESLRSFALTLRELGRRDAIIRAEVLELVRANRGTMREGDLAFLERRVRLALDEILGSTIDPVN
ncbi:hypothetical protein [Singulisphaera sp. PoT]|uniref:hypothetical protein n=1 Tax=Singulisphaera sp. PoT TaxID=3411797 RepID=UPI003BF5C5FC